MSFHIAGKRRDVKGPCSFLKGGIWSNFPIPIAILLLSSSAYRLPQTLDSFFRSKAHMAEIPAPPPLQNQHFEDLIVDGAGAIAAEHVPTTGEILAETERLNQLKRCHSIGDNAVTPGEYARGIKRCHNLVHKAARADLGDVGYPLIMVNQMHQAVQAILQNSQEMNGNILVMNQNLQAMNQVIVQGFEALRVQMDALRVQMDVSNRRTYNVLVAEPKGVELRQIPKLTAGHPVVAPHQFAFAQAEYPVGSLPPDGLIPNIFQNVWTMDNLQNMMLAIYWFYNDQRLHPGQLNIEELPQNLVNFLKYP